MTPNNSSTGGYLVPAAQGPYPGSLTFQQFLQSVFVGISGLDGTLVRPSWQKNPPKQPDGDVNWMAFGVSQIQGDANAYVGLDASNNNTTLRHEELEVLCSFYGPSSESIGSQVRDGFQIPQNLEGLRAANMGFKEASLLRHVPELVNELWIDKWVMNVYLRREIMRVYPILTFLSAQGTIKAMIGPTPSLKTINVNVES